MDLDKETIEIYTRLPLRGKMEFDRRYEIEKKKPWAYYLLLFFLGAIGVHKFYVRLPQFGFVYLGLRVVSYIISPTSLILSFISLGLLIYDLFTGVSQVRKCNEEYFRKMIDEFNLLDYSQLPEQAPQQQSYANMSDGVIKDIPTEPADEIPEGIIKDLYEK
jgi:hypothetical protein